MIPLKAWMDTARGWSQAEAATINQVPQLRTTFMFSCSGTDVLPQRDEGLGEPWAVIKSYLILAPTPDLNSGGRIYSQE